MNLITKSWNRSVTLVFRLNQRPYSLFLQVELTDRPSFYEKQKL